jgi:hypothetical protein
MTKHVRRLFIVLELFTFASLVGMLLSELHGLVSRVRALELDVAPLSQAADLDSKKCDALREEIVTLKGLLLSSAVAVPLSSLADGARQTILHAGMKICRFSLLDVKGSLGVEFVVEGSVGSFIDTLIALEQLPGAYSASHVSARRHDESFEATIRIAERRKQ